MRAQICLIATAALAGAAFAQNTLTPAEQASGWVALFDGSSTDAWRGYRKEGFPDQGWSIDDGALRVHAGGGGGDIITQDMYSDFEFELEYKVAEGANSGIMYLVQEKHDTTWQTGPEFQILDNAGYGVEPTDAHAAGALYDLYSPAEAGASRPAGEWNTVRILLKDGRLEHWLNGAKVVDNRTDTDEWRSKIAGSKFAGYEGFGVLAEGHVALQDHGNDVWFRNIKIRDLSGPLPGETALIGNDMRGWTVVHKDGAEAPDNWSLRSGVLRCEGVPNGYIRTDKAYGDFAIRFQYRFADGEGNSGFLWQVSGEDKVWPSCLEAQLHHGNAGDWINIGRLPFQPVAEDRTSGIRTVHAMNAERPLGEWNDYEIVVMGGTAMVRVNGIVVNESTGLADAEGHLAWQSEGVPMEFRHIFIKPL